MYSYNKVAGVVKFYIEVGVLHLHVAGLYQNHYLFLVILTTLNVLNVA
jgi:hypothetical protein